MPGREPSSPNASQLPKIAAAAVALAALFVLFRLLPVAAWIEAFKAFVKAQGTAGALIFGLVYVGASLVPGGPAALLTLAAGAVYGLVAGTVLVSFASITAATLAFLLARGTLRE
ncbi:MAG TPA: pyridine nucleotide-disulfide oxidoreductase, partial [Thermoanaerobaculia bacterium]|nr:pyridine nucleotide-disulfide oxidoreductase [Thermoanaerobaculia bacterium]